MSKPTVGVLALQGDVREHQRILESLGAQTRPVRRPSELAEVDALVIPGGESTTMDKLLRAFDLDEPMRDRIKRGMPAFGSCAGMILLADRVANGIDGQRTIGGLDVTVRRNAFGRQVDSFEADLAPDPAAWPAIGEEKPLHAVFIRAPWVESMGAGVETLATVADGPFAGRIVAVRQGPVLATAFHPELTGDTRVHRLFLDLVKES